MRLMRCRSAVRLEDGKKILNEAQLGELEADCVRKDKERSKIKNSCRMQ